MASIGGLSLEAVRDYMLSRGGKVTNHDLVKHFKDILTNPECRAEARNEFKEIVNTVATIVKSEEGEKYLVLKKRYRTPDLTCPGDFPSPGGTSPKYSVSSSSSFSSLVTPTGMGLSHSVSQDSLDSVTSPRNPPPYRPPPPPTPPAQPSTPIPSVTVVDSPPVPPRRKSSEKIKLDNKENSSPDISKRPKPIGAEAETDENENAEDEGKVSVKEYMQKFQRMASESALQKLQVPTGKKRFEKGGSDRDDDSVSVTSLDPKAREWLVRAAQADYQNLAKLASENSRLPRLKDPTSTALHWAAKHGNMDVIKLIAGTHEADVNIRTNGGYTPLHLAMQFDHEEVYNILVQVYGADPNLRDWSGRKPRQYQTNKDTSVSADTFRKIKARKKQSEKDLGFLRIGSLNVRVKRTTEAFSQYFLGAGHSTEKLHKTWGSADNIPEVDGRKMPPPKYAPIKKRKSRRAADFASYSHSLPKPENSEKSAGESDSDTAAGFGTTWQGTV